jgi:hypothetical protein
MATRKRPRLQQVPTLLRPGTKVYTEERGVREYGAVQLYEHYAATQNTFPVKFGSQWRVMTFDDVTVLPDAEQPPGLEAPKLVGSWYKNLPDPAILLPKHRNGAGEPATVIVAATNVA